jgi:branched-subunit amino acid transport protein
MSLLLTILAAGAITYATRASFIIAADRVALPASIERALKYVAPAAFAAIAAPPTLGGDQFVEFSDDIPRIIAVLLAGVVIAKTRSVPLSLFTGMSALWLILWIS